MKTLVVNLYGGPGCGKSTTAAGVFFELKTRGINSELAAEFAKDLTWENRHHTLLDQIYVFGKQFYRIFRLLGKVDVIVTDSPIILSLVYDAEKRESLKTLALDEHRKMWSYNILLNRKKTYNPKGRNQTEDEAKVLDKRIYDLLSTNGIGFETVGGTTEGIKHIADKIEQLLAYENHKA